MVICSVGKQDVDQQSNKQQVEFIYIAGFNDDLGCLQAS